MISVVTATLNPRFLNHTIESVLAQRDVDFEHIIVDDGSDLVSVEGLVGRFSDPRLKYVRIPHQGPAGALNQGIGQAKGGYIAILDHDDALTSDSLKRRSDFLDQNASFDAVSGGIYLIDENGDIYKKKVPRKQRTREEMFKDLLTTATSSLFHCTLMCRSLVFEKIGGYNTELVISFDGEMFLRLLDAGMNIGELQEPLAFYRTHCDCLSRVGCTHNSEWDHIYDRFVSNPAERNYLKLRRRGINLLKSAYRKVSCKKI